MLYTILWALIPSKLKSFSTGQSIVQASRSRSVTEPMLVGLGVTLDHSSGSKWLLDELPRLGFSISSDEVRYLHNQFFFLYRHQLKRLRSFFIAFLDHTQKQENI